MGCSSIGDRISLVCWGFLAYFSSNGVVKDIEDAVVIYVSLCLKISFNFKILNFNKVWISTNW